MRFIAVVFVLLGCNNPSADCHFPDIQEIGLVSSNVHCTDVLGRWRYQWRFEVQDPITEDRLCYTACNRQETRPVAKERVRLQFLNGNFEPYQRSPNPTGDASTSQEVPFEPVD